MGVISREAFAERRWNQLVGSFWDAGKVARTLQTKGSVIRGQERRRAILGLRTKEGSLVFPIFQFVQNSDSGNWSLVPGLRQVLEPFRGLRVDGMDWTLAYWFVAPREVFERKSIIDCLKQGLHTDLIVAMAKDSAARWSR